MTPGGSSAGIAPAGEGVHEGRLAIRVEYRGRSYPRVERHSAYCAPSGGGRPLHRGVEYRPRRPRNVDLGSAPGHRSTTPDTPSPLTQRCAFFSRFSFCPFFPALCRFSPFGKIHLPPFAVSQDLKHPGQRPGKIIFIKDLTCPGHKVRPTLAHFPLISLRDSRQAK